MSDKKPGYLWNFIADLGNGVQISTQGNFAEGATKEDMDAEMDKIRAVLDRQQAKSALIAMEQELDVLALRLQSAEADLAEIDKKRGEAPLKTVEVQQREAAVKHIEKMRLDLDAKKEMTEKVRQEAK